MPLLETKGAGSAQGFGEFTASAAKNYIEDVFSTYLYTGNGSTQTITNGIDLSTKGGLVWLKDRTTGTAGYDHALIDTVRGSSLYLKSNLTSAESSNSNVVTGFNSNGFGIGSNTSTNKSSDAFVSWTFREQPKFFDVVTWSGNNTAGREIPHSLGSVPGFIVVKCTTNASTAWTIYHRSLGATQYLEFDTGAVATAVGYWNNTEPTSTVFTLGNDGNVNATGRSYVAYLFAHNAGGFGLTGTDNVISCGSFTTDGSGNATVNLGYEPQWVMYKSSSTAGGDWQIFDSMRGLTMGADNTLSANATTAEGTGTDWLTPSATGFSTVGAVFYTSATYIYIAIRRGPMKVPTSGTSVFEPVTSTSANFIKGTLEASDMGWFKDRATVANWFVGDRLRGIMSYYNPTLYTNLTNAEATPTTGDTVTSTSSEGTGNGKIYFGGAGATTDQPLGYSFKRAPSFFDEVCYTGTGSARTVTHNLGAVPELMIVKSRSSGTLDWLVYSTPTGNANSLLLNTTDASFASSAWGSTTPTASVFSTGATSGTNNSGATFVAYLFATCAGVSKVGSYTGTGTTLQVNCGFTGGARFVLIKRTDSTGDWYVWDSARGIVAGNDPYLLLNSTAAEVTSTDYIDTYSAGFEISSTAPAAINASGGTFIFLAIA